MTAVLAIEHPEGVLIACDSFVGDDWADRIDRPKWFSLSRNLTLGWAGVLHGPLVVQAKLRYQRRRRNEEDVRYLYRTIAQPLHKILAESGIKADDEDNGVCFLIVYDGRVYSVLDNGAVLRSHHGYMVIGEGEELALGALCATEDMPPRERAERALRAAVRHNRYIQEPFFFQDLPAPRQRST